MKWALRHSWLSILHHPIQALIALALVLGAFFSIFTPNYQVFRWGAIFTDRLVVAYLLLSMLFLVLRKHRLMFIGLACCAALCIFLKNAFNSNLIKPILTGAPTLSVAQFTLSASEEEKDQFIAGVLATDADIISIQETNPYWGRTLQAALQEVYPYSVLLNRVDIFGLAIFSKKPIVRQDTFYYKEIPNLVTFFLEEQDTVALVTSHTEPPFNKSGLEKLKEHLDTIGNFCAQRSMPLLACGNYNAVLWTPEIQAFRKQSQLEDSRSGFMANYPEGKFSLFNIPIDHIFFSKEFKCIDFKAVEAPDLGNIGIVGKYQYHSKKLPYAPQ